MQAHAKSIHKIDCLTSLKWVIMPNSDISCSNSSLRVEKEGLDSSMSRMVNRLKSLKRKLVEQRHVGDVKKFPPFWTMDPQARAASGRFDANGSIPAFQKLVGKHGGVQMWG